MIKAKQHQALKSTNDRCVAQVHDTGCRSVTFHQCIRKGILQHKGKLYCKQHYPPNVEAKQQAEHTKWEAEWKSKEERWATKEKAQKELERKAAAYDRLVEWLAARNRPNSPSICGVGEILGVLAGKEDIKP